MENNILERINEAEGLFASYEITGKELARVRQLKDKLENEKMTVSVIGQFKRGKSALTNGILGDKILPVGIVPVTAVVTTIEYGEKGAAVHFANGVVKETAFEDIHTYVNEQENSDNHLGVTKVAIKCPSEFLKSGLTFVDTPGVGSMHENNTEEAYNFVKESDAVIFTLSVDSPINQIEIDFLKNAKEYAAKFYFAVNKIDVIDPEDLDAYIEYCRKFISGLMEVEDIHMFAVSAKKNIGVDELKEAILRDCASESRKILEQSSRLKLHDIIVSALSQITLYRSALSMPGDEFDQRFGEIKEFFEFLHNEAAGLPEALKKNGAVCEAHLNDVKNRLTAKVRELFGIDYHYEIGEVSANGQASGDIVAKIDALCEALNTTLNTIFMYREENAYKVVRRINDLNRLVRKLVKMRDEL
ncbi:MAG: dynamin family protein [Firmicutes bacterium]|nr:dynamin family protein [Bacillota bacterium]